jgi:hypothetical protein
VPFCPLCGAEYREGFDRCHDCDVDLVDELPDEEEWDPTDWVTVEEAHDETTAAIIEGFLLERGMTVRVLSRRDRDLASSLRGLGTVAVQVPTQDMDRALEALAEHDEGSQLWDPDGTGGPDEPEP